MIDYIKAQKGSDTTTFLEKAGCSMFAGSFGSFVGNPCDVALIRLQADTSLPVEERRNYTGALNALRRIPVEEGITACWIGAVPTMARATMLNMSMMITYDTVKEKLDKFYGTSNPFKIQVMSSMMAAINVALFTLPFDNIKTKIQKQKPLADGTMPYKGFIHCVQ